VGGRLREYCTCTSCLYFEDTELLENDTWEKRYCHTLKWTVSYDTDASFCPEYIEKKPLDVLIRRLKSE